MNVRQQGYGFLQARTSEVPSGYSLVVLPGLAVERLLFGVSLIESADAPVEHLVISASHPRLDATTCEQVRRAVSTHRPAARTSFVTEYEYVSTAENSTYRCTVLSVAGSSATEAAAAVAEWIRSGTIDDVDSVTVTVNNQLLVVALRWAGTHAEVTVRSGAS